MHTHGWGGDSKREENLLTSSAHTLLENGLEDSYLHAYTDHTPLPLPAKAGGKYLGLSKQGPKRKKKKKNAGQNGMAQIQTSSPCPPASHQDRAVPSAQVTQLKRCSNPKLRALFFPAESNSRQSAPDRKWQPWNATAGAMDATDTWEGPANRLPSFPDYCMPNA